MSDYKRIYDKLNPVVVVPAHGEVPEVELRRPQIKELGDIQALGATALAALFADRDVSEIYNLVALCFERCLSVYHPDHRAKAFVDACKERSHPLILESLRVCGQHHIAKWIETTDKAVDELDEDIPEEDSGAIARIQAEHNAEREEEAARDRPKE